MESWPAPAPPPPTWTHFLRPCPPPRWGLLINAGGGQVTVASFGSAYGILVLTRNSYLAFLHMIACMHEINAPIFGGHWESTHFKWAHLNSNAPGPGRNDRTCSTFAPFACFSLTANSLKTRKFWRFTPTLKEWEKTQENGDVKSSHLSPVIPGQQTFFLKVAQYGHPPLHDWMWPLTLRQMRFKVN